MGTKTFTKQIIMLANGHPVFDTRIFIKEARSLSSAGFNVSLIIPTARSDRRDRISILAVAPAPKGWQQLFINPWRILVKAVQQPSNAIFVVHDSDILVAGLVLKLLGRKVVYDAHEDTPLQISYQHWIPGMLRKPYAGLYFITEKLCGWVFEQIIVAEPVIAKYFPKHKTHLVRNFPIADSFQSHRPVAYSMRKMRLIHVGTLTRVRGLFEMLEGAKQAAAECDFEFFLGGKFAPPNLAKGVLDQYNVNFKGWVSYSELLELLFDSRIGIIIPNPVERYKTNYPVKLFEFMAAGLPVIASKEGESAAFVEEGRCGILVDPLDTAEIGRAIAWLLTHPSEAEAMGRRGQELIFTKYKWENESAVLIRVLSAV